MDKSNEFLESLFDHILHISKGECLIEYEDIAVMETKHPLKASILLGLKFLHEDLSLQQDDIQENLEAEYRLKLLEKKSRDLEKFNYIASHDLKEPITTIKSFGELLKSRYDEKLDAEAMQYLSYIVAAAKNMRTLIDGLLNFSSANDLTEREEVNCNTVVAKILDTIRYDNKVIAEVSLLPTMQVDKIAISQIFENLLDNALKFRHNDRDLEVCILYESSVNKHQFAIKDNGIGIKEEYYEKIFNLLTRLHNKSEIEGAGIGLNICRKIIEGLGGEIWVESTLGEGSTFFFNIPKKLNLPKN